MRKFLAKKKEFQSGSNNAGGGGSNPYLSKISRLNTINSNVGESFQKEAGIIFEKGKFLPSKKINIEKLPKMNESFDESYIKPSEKV